MKLLFLKKTISIFLLAIFLVSTTGLTIRTHYCQGKEQNREISDGHASHSCCSNPEEMPKDCCNDQFITLKVIDNFNTSATDFDYSVQFIPLPYFIFPEYSSGEAFLAISDYEPDIGPPFDDVPFQVLHQSFLN